MARLDPRGDEREILRSRWPNDPIAPLVLRAATNPTTLAANPALAPSLVADLIAAIGPVGAGAPLLQSGLSLVFENYATIYVPGLEASADEASFVAEGAPISVRMLTSGTVALEPRKMAVIVVLTAEMLVGSNAEALVTDALTRCVGLALDAALFDSVGADAVRPAGLRHGITALAASASSDPDEDMIADMVALATAVAPIGGPIMFVASPGRAVAMSLRMRRELPFTVLGSPAIAAGDLIAIAVNGVVSAVDGAPEIETSRVATVHMSDTPTPIVDNGGTVAAPARSLWQSASVGIKLRFDASWALRDAGGLAWIENCTW
jgi:hypothetical protein